MWLECTDEEEVVYSEVQDESGEVRARTLQSSNKDFGFYYKRNGKPLQCFKQGLVRLDLEYHSGYSMENGLQDGVQ